MKGLEFLTVEQIQTCATLCKDMVEKGGLKAEDILLKPPYFSLNYTSGTYKDSKFIITWNPKEYFILSMGDKATEALSDLVMAFSKVLKDKPFCKYSSADLITYEWNQRDPEKRLKELEDGKFKNGLSRIRGLVRL